MLTVSEKLWLTKRSQCPYFACSSCVWRDTSLPSHLDRIKKGYIHGCNADCGGFLDSFVTEKDLVDAAEFSDRVAAKLARYAAMQSQQYGCEDCVCTKAGVCYNGIKKECADIFLQTARFAVEEEMDADQR